MVLDSNLVASNPQESEDVLLRLRVFNTVDPSNHLTSYAYLRYRRAPSVTSDLVFDGFNASTVPVAGNCMVGFDVEVNGDLVLPLSVPCELDPASQVGRFEANVSILDFDSLDRSVVVSQPTSPVVNRDSTVGLTRVGNPHLTAPLEVIEEQLISLTEPFPEEIPFVHLKGRCETGSMVRISSPLIEYPAPGYEVACSEENTFESDVVLLEPDLDSFTGLHVDVEISISQHFQGQLFEKEHRIPVRLVASDTDFDGVIDLEDNCPYRANPDQSDVGGIGFSSVPDGIGDACQCGDVSGDGEVSLSDNVRILRWILDPVENPLSVPMNCNVGGNPECDIVDAEIIKNRLLSPPRTVIQQSCVSALELF